VAGGREIAKKEIHMISVLASITVKPGMMEDFLKVFKANVPQVRAEVGCLEYAPTVDIDAELPPQQLDSSIVTIIEKWARLADLHEHLKAPHMLAYKEQVKDMVAGVSLKVLQEA
jgi:quinol monooxygenase YgiN